MRIGLNNSFRVSGNAVGRASSIRYALRPIATRTKQTFVNTHSSDGVNTQGKYLVRHKVLPGGCFGGIKLVYANRCSEANGFNSITVAARIRYPSGTGAWTPVTFSTASNVTITASGNDVFSDAINITMAAGQRFDVETYVTVASAGMKWPTLDNLSLSSANGEGSLLSTSDISASTPTPLNTTEIYAPVAILGQSTATRAIAVIGDSIADGAVDTLTGDDMGFIERVFNGSYPVLNCATSSERISQFATAHSKRLALLLASGITDIVFAFGTNDVANGDTYATVRGNLLAVLALLAAQGKAITICPILVKCSGNISTPATGFTVGGVADQINTFISGTDIGLVSKFWDTRTGWQDASNHILSGTYTADFLHPNATGNAAIAAAAPAVSTLLASTVPSAPVASAWFLSNCIYLRVASLALNDGDQVTTWNDTRGLVTATWAGEKPKYRTGMTPSGKPAIKFDVAGTGLEKLVIPHGAQVDNIFGSIGGVLAVARFASAGGNTTGRLWTKGVGETDALSSAVNLRATIDFNTGDAVMNTAVAINTWYSHGVFSSSTTAQNSYTNTLVTATTASGSTTHVDNSGNDFIIGNHDTLARGWDGDLAGLVIHKGTTATADQFLAAMAYLRADTGVTII
jgi:lysophospholipase L1-like esterase